MYSEALFLPLSSYSLLDPIPGSTGNPSLYTPSRYTLVPTVPALLGSARPETKRRVNSLFHLTLLPSCARVLGFCMSRPHGRKVQSIAFHASPTRNWQPADLSRRKLASNEQEVSAERCTCETGRAGTCPSRKSYRQPPKSSE